MQRSNRLFICSAHIPYLIWMVLIAVVLTTGSVLLYALDQGEKNFAIQFFTPFMLIAALWCLIETVVALFSGIRITGGMVRLSRTIGQAKQEFPLSSVMEIYRGDKTRSVCRDPKIRGGYLLFLTERGTRYAIQFPVLTEARFSAVVEKLRAAGYDPEKWAEKEAENPDALKD